MGNNFTTMRNVRILVEIGSVPIL